jgi:aerobic carbon-monoxide dehydrogenase medium subunit
MYPARFEYVAPTTIDEVLGILGDRGDDAKVLAGGQSLVPMTPASVSVEINGRDSSS